MSDTNKFTTSRRKFLETATSFTAGIALGGSSLIGAPSILRSYNKPNSLINGVQIGVITYSFRSLKDQSAEATLKYITECGISAIELMGDPAESFAGKPKSPVDRRAFFRLMRAQRSGEELTEEQKKEMQDIRAQMEAYNKEVVAWRTSVSMDKFEQIRKMYADAGVSIYGFKPNAFGKNNTDAEINYGMRAAKALGASHITLEHPSDDAHTLKLGKMAKKHKIYVGYHGHTQQTPTFWDTALKQSKFNALNIDIGHYVAAGNTNTLQIVEEKSKRIKSMHLKDRKNKANGQANMPWGQGDTPIPEVLRLMRDNKYKFAGTIELEYPIPESSDAIKEVQNCVEFCRKALGTSTK